MNLFQRFRADRSGNVVILAAVTIPVVLAGVGAAISYTDAVAVRSDVQAALDAAVLAGAALDTTQSSDQIAAAQTAFAANLARSSTAQTAGVTTNFTVTANGATVSGTATGAFRNPFGGLIGPDSYTIGASASAAKQAIPLCLLGLNSMDNGAMDMNGNAQLSAPSCAVQANSTSSSGLTQEGKPNAVARKIGVSGGHKGDNFSPPPINGSAPISDPYASMPFPPYDACPKGGSGAKINNDATLSPGTYCGGIHVFGNGTQVTLQPGIYVMVDGPFWVDSTAVVTGDKVMIAFTGKGAALQIWGSGTVKLTSPTSGTYTNMQFFQDRLDPNSHGAWDSIGGNATLQYDGVAYFPTQNFWVYGDAVLKVNSPSLAVVADKIWFQGNAQATVTSDNSRNLPVTATKTTFGAMLIN